MLNQTVDIIGCDCILPNKCVEDGIKALDFPKEVTCILFIFNLRKIQYK